MKQREHPPFLFAAFTGGRNKGEWLIVVHVELCKIYTTYIITPTLSIFFFYFNKAESMSSKIANHILREQHKKLSQSPQGSFEKNLIIVHCFCWPWQIMQVAITSWDWLWLFPGTFTANPEWKGHTATSPLYLLSLYVYMEKGLPDRVFVTQ